MSEIDSFAAYGAPALLIVAGYGLVWWTRLSPRLSAKMGRVWDGIGLRQAPRDR